MTDEPPKRAEAIRFAKTLEKWALNDVEEREAYYAGGIAALKKFFNLTEEDLR